MENLFSLNKPMIDSRWRNFSTYGSKSHLTFEEALWKHVNLWFSTVVVKKRFSRTNNLLINSSFFYDVSIPVYIFFKNYSSYAFTVDSSDAFFQKKKVINIKENKIIKHSTWSCFPRKSPPVGHSFCECVIEGEWLYNRPTTSSVLHSQHYTHKSFPFGDICTSIEKKKKKA